MATKKPATEAPAKLPPAHEETASRKAEIPPNQIARSRSLSSHQIMEDLVAHPGKDRNDIAGLLEFYQEMIERLRPAIEKGDGEALVEGLELASFLMAAQRVPAWFAAELQKAVHRYTGMEARTLDEAFKLKKRQSFVPLSKKARYGKRAFFDVCCLHAVGIAIDNDMHQEISTTYPKGVGRDMIKRFYEDENRRRGGRKYDTRVMKPSQLPQRLQPVYQALAKPALAEKAFKK
jgi:hypothetical protein